MPGWVLSREGGGVFVDETTGEEVRVWRESALFLGPGEGLGDFPDPDTRGGEVTEGTLQNLRFKRGPSEGGIGEKFWIKRF